jgi:hypothetical protein
MFLTLIDNRLRSFFSFLLLFLWGLTISASAQTPAEKIFPDSTKGFLVIHNLKELGIQWRKTQIGTLMNAPVMTAFKKDLQEQLEHRMKDRFGLTLDGIEQLPSGEVAVGMIAIPNETPGYIFTMDITDRRKETDDYLKRLSEKLLAVGVKRTVEKYKEQEIAVLAFPDRSQAVLSDSPKSKEKTTPESVSQYTFSMIKNDHLLVSDQRHLVQLIADRMDKLDGKSLADVDDFKVVMKRCLDDAPNDNDSKPLIRWYIEPLNYGESIRVLLRGPTAEKRKSKPSLFTILKQQGFDALRGVGGVVSIKAENKESVFRVFVYTQKPYKLAMQMFMFPDSTNFGIPDWMPPDIARCTVLFVEPLAIFDNFGTLFDALIMQGETGAWKDILKGIQEDPYGPQINIREEILVNFGQRVLGMSKYDQPITPTSESIVVAVELKEGKESNMINALKKLFENDSEMQPVKYKSYTLWQRAPEEDIIPPSVGPSTGVPSLGGTVPTQDASQQTNHNQTFPDGAVTVAKGCLFVTTNGEYLKTILDRLDTVQQSIKGEAEYVTVNDIFANMGLTDKPHFLQFFSRTDKTLQPTYELVRQGKMPQSQAVLGKVMNALLVPEDEEGVRPQAIDGKNLPEFDKVRHYFGPSGFYGISEENGYFFKGFLLEKKAEKEIDPNPKNSNPDTETEAVKPNEAPKE